MTWNTLFPLHLILLHQWKFVGQRRISNDIWLKEIPSLSSWQTFFVYTDHKPLTHIFNPARAIPVMESACIQHWALTIGAYDYEIQVLSKPMLMLAVTYHCQKYRL